MSIFLKLLAAMTLCVPIVLLSIAQQRSQSSKEVQVEPSRFDPLKFPDGEDAWIIRFDSVGGHDGGRSGIINSLGDIYTKLPHCSPTVCQTKMSPEETQELSQMILSLKPSAWEARYPAVPPGYNDLRDYGLTLLRRTADSTEHVYTAEWSDLNIAEKHLRTDITALYGKIYIAMHKVHLSCRKCPPPPINQGEGQPLPHRHLGPPTGPNGTPLPGPYWGPPAGSPQHRTQSPVLPPPNQ